MFQSSQIYNIPGNTSKPVARKQNCSSSIFAFVNCVRVSPVTLKPTLIIVTSQVQVPSIPVENDLKIQGIEYGILKLETPKAVTI